MSTQFSEISSAEQAITIFNSLANDPARDYGHFKISPGWAMAQIYIPNTSIPSSISTSMMSAFISIQKDIFHLATFAKTGISDIRKLDDIDRHEMEILVKVSGESSEYNTDLANPLEILVKLMINKLTGRQVTIIALGLGILFSGTYGFSSWLEQKKETQLEEIKSNERLEALRAMRFASEQQRQMFDLVVQTLTEIGPVGRRAHKFLDNSFEALLRAAERNDTSRINGQKITAGEAWLLRTSSRNSAVTRFSVEEMRVVDINTSAEVDSIVLRRPSTGIEFRIRFSETLFSGGDRAKLFGALESRSEIRVELAFREVNGAVRDTIFVRVID